MTISNQNKRIAYSGDGASVAFAYNFRILESGSLTVVLQSSAGVDTTQTITTHYTVSGAGDASGGTVTMVTAPAVGETLSIILDPDLTQETDYSSGGSFPAQSHEDALDKLTNTAKRSRDISERSLSLQDGDVEGSGAYDANSNRIKSLGNSVDDQDAVTKADMNAAIAAAQVTPYAGVISSYAGTLLDDVNAAAARATLGSGAAGDLVFTSAGTSTALGHLGFTPYAKTLIDDTDAATARTTLGVPELIPNVNYLDNSDFQVCQWGRTFNASTPYTGANNDDVYFADQWKLVSDGNDVVDISIPTAPNDVPAGAKAAATFTQQGGSPNTKWGIVQFLEQAKTEPLAGKSCSLGIDIKTTGTLQNFKLMVVEWQGTANSITTSDPVAAWNGAEVRPSFGASWAFVTGAELDIDASSGDWARFKLEDFTMPASPNNIAIFLCTNDSSFLAGAVVSVTGVKLEEGALCTPYQSKELATEIAQCERFYQDTFEPETYPVANVGNTKGALSSGTYAEGASTYQCHADWRLSGPMLTDPTVTTYNPEAAGTAWAKAGGSTTKAAGTLVASRKAVAVPSAADSSNLGTFFIHASASARL